jgi:hypothetical protein
MLSARVRDSSTALGMTKLRVNILVLHLQHQNCYFATVPFLGRIYWASVPDAAAFEWRFTETPHN